MTKNIKVREDTYEKLTILGNLSGTYDSVLQKLIERYKIDRRTRSSKKS